MKFFIAFVLALAIFGFSSAQGTPGGYTPIQWDPSNQQLVNALNYGVNQAVPKAIAAGQISNGKWNWTNVISVQEQVVAGMNYDFIVDIADGNGDTARLNVIVFVAPGGKTMSLSNWAIFMLQSQSQSQQPQASQATQGTQGAAGGYTPIQWNPNNEELVSLLDYGVEEAVPEAIAAGKIAKGQWNWTKVNSVQAQVVAGMNYMFNVDIADGTGDVASMNVIVFDGLDGTMSLVSYEILLM